MGGGGKTSPPVHHPPALAAVQFRHCPEEDEREREYEEEEEEKEKRGVLGERKRRNRRRRPSVRGGAKERRRRAGTEEEKEGEDRESKRRSREQQEETAPPVLLFLHRTKRSVFRVQNCRSADPWGQLFVCLEEVLEEALEGLQKEVLTTSQASSPSSSDLQTSFLFGFSCIFFLLHLRLDPPSQNVELFLPPFCFCFPQADSLSQLDCG